MNEDKILTKKRNKEILIGIAIGTFLPVVFSFVLLASRYPEIIQTDFFRTLWGGAKFGPILRLSVLINLPVFFVLLQFNKDNYSRGILLGTFVIGLYIFALHLIG